ncbi:WD40-repeat-containing domain protein [Pyronema domesticum]|uniref:Similar to U5 small nuclear ribonucleoprotein 40 kDa protein acc. no. Q5RF51 n=1 Tax=Pyronema omphalodes (strain CBS 100304) TaxID=1076935 RepID=U4LEH1_PYROM|nr:WD40-repeat-containing domain protein [Pyronema domesticum]CCX29942.1 Similar to U5 small nuclear ribonucleoprotein 40 kDa protein; acc. no. Q5RF51 [Pyronema omphalodes CBS 100304]
MSTDKRKAPDNFGSNQLVKRTRPEATNNTSAVSIVGGASGNGALIQAVPRTSGLQAPNMELTGHGKEVYAVRFDAEGQNFASAGFDGAILLWKTYGNCVNYLELKGHKGAVLDLHWSRDSRTIFSASADKDARLASWDIESKTRIRKYEGHEDIVTSLDVSRRAAELVISGSDDGTIGIWDPRKKHATNYFESNMPITSVAMSEAGNEIFSGGIDNDIKVWDIRKGAVSYTLRGHQDTITSLEVSPDGQTLLSNSMDSTVRTWDIRAFASAARNISTFEGAPAGIEKNLIRASWSPNGERIGAGGADGQVCVWDVESRKMLYKLPGHRGTVNDMRFSPNVAEPIIVSASSDKSLILGELGK